MTLEYDESDKPWFITRRLIGHSAKFLGSDVDCNLNWKAKHAEQ